MWLCVTVTSICYMCTCCPSQEMPTITTTTVPTTPHHTQGTINLWLIALCSGTCALYIVDAFVSSPLSVGIYTSVGNVTTSSTQMLVFMCTCCCMYCVSLVPGVHGQAETMPGFSRLCMCENFPEIWETVLFWYFSVYGIHITVLL